MHKHFWNRHTRASWSLQGIPLDCSADMPCQPILCLKHFPGISFNGARLCLIDLCSTFDSDFQPACIDMAHYAVAIIKLCCLQFALLLFCASTSRRDLLSCCCSGREISLMLSSDCCVCQHAALAISSCLFVCYKLVPVPCSSSTICSSLVFLSAFCYCAVLMTPLVCIVGRAKMCLQQPLETLQSSQRKLERPSCRKTEGPMASFGELTPSSQLHRKIVVREKVPSADTGDLTGCLLFKDDANKCAICTCIYIYMYTHTHMIYIHVHIYIYAPDEQTRKDETTSWKWHRNFPWGYTYRIMPMVENFLPRQ